MELTGEELDAAMKSHPATLGDTVRVRGVSGPEMKVLARTVAQRSVTSKEVKLVHVVHTMWFDKNDCIQSMSNMDVCMLDRMNDHYDWEPYVP